MLCEVCGVPTSPQVSVVLDPDFGFRLAEQVSFGPVWIIDTPINRAAFEKHWAEHRGESHLQGVTSFAAWSGASAEGLLIGEIDTIDLHHGHHSAEVPYAVLEVVGTALTSKLEEVLSEYGFVAFESTVEGFRASRAHETRTKADSLRE